MDKLLQTTFDLVHSDEPKKVLKGIEQTDQLPEPLALGMFALSRRTARSFAGPEIDAIETAIAGTNRVGLNPAQVAEQLTVQINQRPTLTETQYRIIAEMLGVIRVRAILPELRKDGIVQLDAFAELVRRGEEPDAQRALEKGLYDWRGRPRADTASLAATLPFLKPDIDRFARRSLLAYPASLATNMKDAIVQGRASAGFFITAMVLIVIVFVIALATRTTNTVAAVEPAKVAAPQAKASAPPTLAGELAKAFADDKTCKRYDDATIVVLDDADAPIIIEVLSKALRADIISARGTFGQAPEGCDWLEREDVNLLDPAPALNARIIIACFERTSQGRQFRFVALPSRVIELAVSVPDAPRRIVPSAEQFVTVAEEEYQSRLQPARAELAFRQAKAAAGSERKALGRFHRRYAAFLDYKKAAERDIAEHFRLAARYLPAAEFAEVPEAIRRQYKLPPTFAELENRMTTTTRGGEAVQR